MIRLTLKTSTLTLLLLLLFTLHVSPFPVLAAGNTITIIEPTPSIITPEGTVETATIVEPGQQGIPGPQGPTGAAGADSTVPGPQGAQGETGPAGTTDHTLLTNIGLTAHSAIDTALSRLADTSGANTGDQDLSGLVPKTYQVNGHALSGNVSVTASDIGHGNVDNTSDANKPVSTAQQTALDLKSNLISPSFTTPTLGAATGTTLNLGSGIFSTTDSTFKTGSLELQPYALNNGWIGENAYFNAGWKYRATGYASTFYFNTGEGQFRVYASGTAGSALPNSASNTDANLKINASGAVAIGGNMSSTPGNYTGANMLVNSMGRTLIGTVTDDGINKLQVAGAIKNAVTLPSGAAKGFEVAATGSGSTGVQYGQYIGLNAGHTGPDSYGFGALNLSVNTGATMNDGTDGYSYRIATGSAGGFGISKGTTVGQHIGLVGTATGGNINIGTFGSATYAKNSAANIGVAGFGLNTGSTPTQIGGYFSLYASSGYPTFVSAALIADNGSQTSPIFLARDNGATVFTIADGGAVTSTSTITGTQYNLSALNTAPASATAACTTGEMRYTATYHYICAATNTWVRSAIYTTW